MIAQIFIGLATEGPTDIRFFESIVRRTFQDIALKECRTDVDIDIQRLKTKKTGDDRKRYNIYPAQSELDRKGDDYCKILTPVIPVRMMEAWMLADKDLLKAEIGTRKSDNDLGIDRDPEVIADPKSVIEEAIRVAQSDLPRRRQRLTISDLYEIIGDKISIDKLLLLNSYRRFQEEVRSTYRALNYM